MVFDRPAWSYVTSHAMLFIFSIMWFTKQISPSLKSYSEEGGLYPDEKAVAIL